MRQLHIFTEEPSLKKVFEIILPKILPVDYYYRIYSHQGKQDLEAALTKTMPSISKIPGAKILITRDQDNEDCKGLKAYLNKIIINNCHCDYLVRIVCRELEAWYLGDLLAIETAYPRFKANSISSKASLRTVDSIHKPSKYLLNVIPELGNKERLPKLETAEKIAPFLDIDRNKSESFKQTIQAIKSLAAI